MMSAHPDDEALSAAVDGQDPAAAKHAETCTACQARMATLSRAATLVATPVAPVADQDRDRAVAAAISASTGVFAPPVAGQGRGRWRPALVAAAAVVLLVGLVAGLTTLSGRDTKKAATSSGAQSATSARRDLVAGGAASETAGGAVTLAADLGDVPDEAALRARLAQVFGQKSTAAPTAEGTATAAPAPTTDACETAAARAVGPDAEIVYRAQLTYAGVRAEVVVVRSAGQLVAVVTDPAACRTLARTPVGA